MANKKKSRKRGILVDGMAFIILDITCEDLIEALRSSPKTKPGPEKKTKKCE